MDLLTRGSGSARCIRVWIMVDDEASGCQGQLHTGRGAKHLSMHLSVTSMQLTFFS